VVEPYAGQEHPDYLLSGRLERLDEVDYNGGVQVEAMISAELVNLRTGASVWVGTVTERSNVSAQNMNSIVVAMSHAAQSGVDQLVANMEKQLSETSVAVGNCGTTTAEISPK
jgi:hypothetical protein